MDITQAIVEVSNQYIVDNLAVSAKSINHGLCEEFAEDVCKLVHGATAYWDDELGDYDDFGGHKVICYNGRFYDSECPLGTLDWRELVRFPSPCNNFNYT